MSGALEIRSYNTGSRRRYAVYRGADRLTYGFADRDAAVAQMERMERNQPKRARRACLTCGAAFESEHVGNRMCDPCRKGGSLHDSLATGYGVVLPSRRGSQL
jgi:hypothetical protein